MAQNYTQVLLKKQNKSINNTVDSLKTARVKLKTGTDYRHGMWTRMLSLILTARSHLDIRMKLLSTSRVFSRQLYVH